MQARIDWPGFLARHDLVWTVMPAEYQGLGLPRQRPAGRDGLHRDTQGSTTDVAYRPQ